MKLPPRLVVPFIVVAVLGTSYTYLAATTVTSMRTLDVVSAFVRDMPVVGSISSALSSTVAVSSTLDAGDAVYDTFSGCAGFYPRPERSPQWVYTVDNGTQTKSCTITVSPDIPNGVAWGPITSYNWNGDFGYWFDAPGVHHTDAIVLAINLLSC
jgi:hypothetical protein